jgi:Uncharacterized conserved protein
MALSASTQRVQQALQELGLTSQILELEASTRTSQQAADAIGCSVSQIAKSLVFRGAQSDKAILVIASGSNRVNEERLAELVGEPIAKADAQFVRRVTGYVIGGVAPVGHLEKLETYIDSDLLQYEEIWAAGGTPHSVFPLTPKDLERITAGRVVSIR